MIYNKKEFYGGGALLAGFFVVLAIIFMPLFNGQNALNYLDALYNSISKGSAYYIPKAMEDAAAFEGKNVELKLAANSSEQAEQLTDQFMAIGALVNRTDNQLRVTGNLGAMLGAILADADAMYNNDDASIKQRYGIDGRRALYNWWTALSLMDGDLKRQKQFKEAKMADTVKTKAVEAAYNYFGIQAESITGRLGVVIFSLVFYVVYTLWYGFAILFLFEGWGLALEH
jgi:hypothetical protein